MDVGTGMSGTLQRGAFDLNVLRSAALEAESEFINPADGELGGGGSGGGDGDTLAGAMARIRAERERDAAAAAAAAATATARETEVHHDTSVGGTAAATRQGRAHTHHISSRLNSSFSSLSPPMCTGYSMIKQSQLNERVFQASKRENHHCCNV